MFEVEPILWLQAFKAGWFFDLMTVLSWLGEGWLYTPLVLLLAFAGRLRPALGLLLAMALVGALTDLAKDGFGLPRPSEVDARVLDKQRSGRHLVDAGGAQGFFALPTAEAIAAARARAAPDFGFISGHTSAAAAFALALALALGFGGARRRWIAAAVVFALLMGLSRMYLGRHFLADVLGGLLVGLLGAWCVATWMKRLSSDGRPGRWAPMLAVAATLIGLSLTLDMPPPGSSGYVMGALLCIAVFERAGYPDDAAGGWRRALRGLCVLAIGYAVIALADLLYEAGGWPDGHPVELLFAGLGTALVFVLGVAACRVLRLYAPAPATCAVSHRD